MSAEIKERLKTTSEVCQKCYEAWDGNEKDSQARESLQEAIHELRKVASRLEIDLAISERDQMTQKPLPIPSHRDSRGGKRGGAQGGYQDLDDNAGNTNNNHNHNNHNNNNSGPKVEIQKKPRTSRTPRKSSGGDN